MFSVFEYIVVLLIPVIGTCNYCLWVYALRLYLSQFFYPYILYFYISKKKD